ncbi:hypothetical protein [Pleomorphomonas koreensis]|uniref:hypothetical protein n=1 Tax=Pleomorphomonas koreensis TaxID=257440 RepID=UPI00040B98CA|nr:hypothetical protein [Pleomorphomonas koreensis]
MPLAVLSTLLKMNGRSILFGLAAVAALLAAWWLFAAGQHHEQAKSDRASLRAYEERNRIDESLDGLSPHQLCRRAGGGDLCDSVRGGAP